MNPTTDTPARVKILCVDDEPSILNVLRRSLSEQFDVLTAPSGKEALALLQQNPDIVVLISDQKMEGMSGTELFAESQKINPDVLRIMLTAYSDVNLILDAINLGRIYHFILKPFELETMAITIRRAVEYYFKQKEYEKTYRDLMTTRSHLMKSEKMALLGRLMTGITHELGNPISNVLQASVLARHEWARLKTLYEGILQAETSADIQRIRHRIQSEELGQTIGEFETVLQTIQNSSEFAKEIFQNLKNFSRLDESEWAPLKINDTIDRAIHLIYPKYKYQVRFHRDYADVPSIRALAGPLTQVMIHLITFIAQQVDQEGDIWIRTWKDGAWVTSSVRVAGLAMSSDRLNHLFEIDHDVDHGNIGLVIAMNIVERHGGSIRTVIKGDRLTEFLVLLPADTIDSKDA